MKYKNKICELFTDYCEKNNKTLYVYTDYRDFENVEYLLKNCNDIDDFIIKVDDAYCEAKDYLRDEYIEQFIKTLSNRYKHYIDDNNMRYNELLDIMYDYIDIVTPAGQFLSQKIKVNLFCFEGASGYENKFLKYLLHSQGLKLKDYPYLNKLFEYRVNCYGGGWSLSKKEKAQLERDMKKSEFIKSLYKEAINLCVDYPRCLAIATRLTIQDYFMLKNEQKDIVVHKNNTIGLVDMYNGGGSILDIRLNNEILIKNKNISCIKVEGIDKYTIDNIYGLCSSCFDGLVEVR